MPFPSPFRIAWAAALLLLFGAGEAGASTNYPSVIEARLGLTKEPACTLCHQDLNGGNGTIVTWFGFALQSRGLQGAQTDSLTRALDDDISEGADSDGDGASDVEEFTMGTDPNDGPGPTGGFPRPERGCSMGRGRGDGVSGSYGSATTLGLMAALFVVRRKRHIAEIRRGRRGGGHRVHGVD